MHNCKCRRRIRSSEMLFAIFIAIVLVLLYLGHWDLKRIKLLEIKPVHVELYFETKCPYSIDFILHQLYPTWKDLKDIIEVELFPFGNSEVKERDNDWTFECQHGASECQSNVIHVCAKNIFKDFNVEIEFLKCFLSSREEPLKAGKKCSQEVGYSWSAIEECAESRVGRQLLHSVADRKDALQPPLSYVPWIIINNHFSDAQVEESQANFKSVVCKMLNGTYPIPEACFDSTFRDGKRVIGGCGNK